MPLTRISCFLWPRSLTWCRTAFLVAVSASMALVTLLTAVADVSWLWLTAPISGAVYGAHWSLIPALASEFFGLSHFGFNYCLLGTSITVMSFSVSNMMVSPPPSDQALTLCVRAKAWTSSLDTLTKIDNFIMFLMNPMSRATALRSAGAEFAGLMVCSIWGDCPSAFPWIQIAVPHQPIMSDPWESDSMLTAFDLLLSH